MYATIGVDILFIHVCILIQEFCFDFFFLKTLVSTPLRCCSILVPSCGTLGQIIIIKWPDTSRNCSH